MTYLRIGLISHPTPSHAAYGIVAALKAYGQIAPLVLDQDAAAQLVLATASALALDDLDALIERTLDQGTSILLLDVAPEVKQHLRPRLGCVTTDASLGYYLARLAPDHYRIINLSATPSTIRVQRHAGAGDAADPASDHILDTPRFTTAPGDSASIAAFVEHVVGHVIALHAPGRRPRPASSTLPIPPEIKKWLCSLTTVHTWTDAETKQTATAHMTYDIGLFLSNPSDAEPYQYVLISQEGTFHPGTLYKDELFRRGWAQVLIQQTLEPWAAPPTLVYKNSSPANTAGEQTVSSSVNFSLGFTTPDGAASTFEYSRSVTEVIKDWRVVEDTVNTRTRWIFAQHLPADAIDARGPFGHWDDAFLWATVREIPSLSKYTLQTDTESLWRTTQVINDPITIVADGYQELAYFGHNGISTQVWTAINSIQTVIELDLSKVV